MVSHAFDCRALSQQDQLSFSDKNTRKGSPPDKEPTMSALASEAPPTPKTPLLPPPATQANREEEIAHREAALHGLERNGEQLSPPDRTKNSSCSGCLKSCRWFSIRDEIPAAEQWKMYSLLAFLIYLWVLLLLNVLVSIYGAIMSKDNKSQLLTTMGVSILYVIHFVPGSLLWFLSAYCTYRKYIPLAFILFLIFMTYQMFLFILNAAGVPNLGACGFFNGYYFFCNECGVAQYVAGAMYMIIGFLWFISAPFALFLLIMTLLYFLSSRGSLNRAAQEAVAGAAGNRHMYGTAVRSSAAMSQ